MHKSIITFVAALALVAACSPAALAADRKPPTITITRPANGAAYKLNQAVNAAYSCQDNQSVASCVGTVAKGSPIDTKTPGSHSFTVNAADKTGNKASKTVTYTVAGDTTAPTITITRPAANAPYQLNQSVTASYSCADTAGSGVKSCTGTVANDAAINTATSGSKTFSVTATDNATNTKTTTVNYTVAADTTAPSIAITTPAQGAVYTVGQVVAAAAYSCADTGGSGLDKCDGTVPSGSPFDTTEGAHSFTVTATDKATPANTKTVTVSYTVQATPPPPSGDCPGGYYGLTFDDGPDPTYTPRVLSALATAKANATFMLLGQNVTAYPQLAKAEHDAGNWIGNHTYTHPDLTTLTSAQATSELTKTQTAILNATGVTPTFARPPFGEFNNQTLSVFSSLGLDNAFWTNDTNDWAGKSVSQIVSAAVAVKPGGIILMHDAQQTTVDAIPQIVDQLKQKGICPGKLAHTDATISAAPAWDGVLFHMVAVKP